LYGVLVSLEIEIKPPEGLKGDEMLRFDWVLTNFDESRQHHSGYDIVHMHPNKKHKAIIVLGYLELPGEYKLKLKFTRNDKDVCEPMTMAQFTVQDRDDFYRNTVIPALTGIFGIVLGALLGVIATKLWGG
jgi:hypothetical protein